jgi:osmotically-inducible protein OsmY
MSGVADQPCGFHRLTAADVKPTLRPPPSFQEGAMKTDSQLQRDVIDELRWDPSIAEKEIGVAVKDGVVTLTGAVPSYADKYAVDRVLERIAGVKAFANELEIELPSAWVRSDTDIAHKVVDAFAWDVSIPHDQIKARVADGWVTLEGEVQWEYQRQAAFRAVRSLTGVRGVTNLIKIVPARVSSYDVTKKIKDALRRSAERDADRIVVATMDHVVTLSGSVPSFAERRLAETAAWSAPGVKEVKDEIVVSL